MNSAIPRATGSERPVRLLHLAVVHHRESWRRGDGPPPASGASIATTALVAYGLFAAIAWLLADRRRGRGAA
jgi:hypothetical protein